MVDVLTGHKRTHADTVVLEQGLMVMMLAIGPTASSGAR